MDCLTDENCPEENQTVSSEVSNQKHTPGPWVIGWSADNGAFHIEPHTGGSVICTRGPWSHKAGASLANARLIAAAPELLEAARAVLREFGHREGDDDALLDPQPQELMRALQAAIAKAEGR